MSSPETTRGFVWGPSTNSATHSPGTREYLTVEQGELELRVGGEVYRLAEGDVVVFRGDQRHAYGNVHSKVSIAYSVIAFAPSGS